MHTPYLKCYSRYMTLEIKRLIATLVVQESDVS